MSTLDHPQVESSLEGFLKQVRPRLKAVFTRYRIPAQDTEDILQQALMALVYRREGIRDPEAWLLGTVRNKCLLYWREQRRELYESVDAGGLGAVARAGGAGQGESPPRAGGAGPGELPPAARSGPGVGAAARALPVAALDALPPGVRSAGAGGAAGLQPREHRQGHHPVPGRADAASLRVGDLPEEDAVTAGRHPEPDVLERFVLGALAPLEMRETARHLLAGCPRCQEITAALWEPADVFEDPETLAAAEVS